MTDIKVVIGANFGDEGKGMMTDYFCEKAKDNCIVVCSNGGSQRGHTVSTPQGQRHVFHHFGSGSFVGADTYLPEKFILNPIMFRKEYEELQKLSINPKVYVHPLCLVSTPFDMISNIIIEESRGKHRHGSCGMGIWETIVRDGLKLAQLQPLSYLDLCCYFDSVRGYFQQRFIDVGVKTIREAWIDIWNDANLIMQFTDDFKFMLSHIKIADDYILQKYSTVVFENGQGLLLDQNIKGYGEHTTPSNTGLKNPAEIINRIFPTDRNVEVCYVSRSYLTRHGAGRFDGECPVENINPHLKDETNVTNSHQGALRYGKFNEKLYKALFKRCCDDYYGQIKDAEITMAMTHLDKVKIPADCYLTYLKYLSHGLTRESIYLNGYYHVNNKYYIMGRG